MIGYLYIYLSYQILYKLLGRFMMFDHVWPLWPKPACADGGVSPFECGGKPKAISNYCSIWAMIWEPTHLFMSMCDLCWYSMVYCLVYHKRRSCRVINMFTTYRLLHIAAIAAEKHRDTQRVNACIFESPRWKLKMFRQDPWSFFWSSKMFFFEALRMLIRLYAWNSF